MEITAEIQKKLQEVIDANLPQQMGATFKKYFEEAEYTKTLLTNERASTKSLNEDKASLIKQVDEFSKKQADFNNILKREADVSAREKAMDIHDLKMKLECSEKKQDMLHNLVSGLTKNTIFRETVFKNDNVSIEYYNGQNFPVNRGSTETIEKKAE